MHSSRMHTVRSSSCLQGVSAQADICPGVVCPSGAPAQVGCLPGGLSDQGEAVADNGDICPGGSARGLSAQGGLCPEGGVCVGGGV